MNPRNKNTRRNAKASSSKQPQASLASTVPQSSSSTARSQKRKRSVDSSDTVLLSGSALDEFIAFQKSKKQQGSRAAQAKKAKAQKDRDTQRELSCIGYKVFALYFHPGIQALNKTLRDSQCSGESDGPTNTGNDDGVDADNREDDEGDADADDCLQGTKTKSPLLDSNEERLANGIDLGMQDQEEDNLAGSEEEEPEGSDGGEMVADDPSVGEESMGVFFKDNNMCISSSEFWLHSFLTSL